MISPTASDGTGILHAIVAPLHSTVYLIRNAQTSWNVDRRLAGRRELGLSPEGQKTAQDLVQRFEGIDVAELLVSPLPRTVETAQPLASARNLDVARDPRLVDWNPGRWEGRGYAEIMLDPQFIEMTGRPIPELAFPGGERFIDVQHRMLSSVDQALQDNELGADIAIVSHAGPLRLLLSHYLSIPVWEHERLRLAPGSVTVLRFSSLTSPPLLVGINTCGPLLDTVGGAR